MFKPGQSGNPKGRPKGSNNKFTDLKQTFLDVFDKIEKEAEEKEHVDGLYDWAMKNSRNQGMFYQIISKMLPTNISADLSGDVNVMVKRVITDERPRE